MMRWLAIALLATTPAWADETEEAEETVVQRPAPEYFIATVIATTTAQQLALSCSTLSLDPPVIQAATDEVLEKLEADGFDPLQPYAEMIDPAPEFQARQEAFVLSHGLEDSPSEDLVCAAGLAEIEDGSDIGKFLVAVE